MNTKSSVALESFRLAQYSVQVPCFVCGTGNAFDAELCRNCYAPMPLTNQSEDSQQKTHLLATVGSSGAGKTVYLGMLMDLLSRQSHHLQMIARGAFSISLQQRTMSALARCEFPEKTPSEPDRWNWVHGSLRMHDLGKDVDLIMPDMAGEAILQEIDHPHTYPVVRAMLEKAAGILLLIDTLRIEDGEGDQDFFGMKVLSYVAELFRKPTNSKSKRRPKDKSAKVPVAVVFTKADMCDICFEDPSEYARKHAPGLWQVCEERFPQRQFFASSVAGACASRLSLGHVPRKVPLRVEPRGIVDPFEWLVEKTIK